MNNFPRVEALLKSKVGFNLNIEADFAQIKKAIEKQYPDAKFMNGQCMVFAIELKRCFPDAKILFNNDHFVTLIDGSLWDYNGKMFFNEHDEPALFLNAMQRAEEFLECSQQTQS